jgi:hypothetical protein
MCDFSPFSMTIDVNLRSEFVDLYSIISCSLALSPREVMLLRHSKEVKGITRRIAVLEGQIKELECHPNEP